MQQLKTMREAGSVGEGNVFYRDGSGHAFYYIPRQIRTTAEGDFFKEITMSVFAVTDIDAPVA